MICSMLLFRFYHVLLRTSFIGRYDGIPACDLIVCSCVTNDETAPQAKENPKTTEVTSNKADKYYLQIITAYLLRS